MAAEPKASGHTRPPPIERLERRAYLWATVPFVSPAAADAGIVTAIQYQGVSPDTISTQHDVLYAPAARVQVSVATFNGTSPTGTVTFRLNGRVAGSFPLDTFEQSTLEANPGTYTLTAHYSGDQSYAPADLPPTVVTFPALSDSMTPELSVTENQPTAPVNAGTALISAFTVNANNPSGATYDDTLNVTVSAVNENDPSVLVPLQDLSGPIRFPGSDSSTAFALAAPTTGLAAGTYQLVYHAEATGVFTTIYSADTFTVAAATTPPADLPAVSRLVGAAASAPVVAGQRTRGLSAAVAVPAAAAGVDTVAVYASETGAIDANSTLVGTVRKRVAVKRGVASATVTVPVQTASAAAGTYVLLARVTGAAGAVTDAAVGPVLAFQPPDVQLRASLDHVSTPFRVGSPLAFTLTLDAVGNVAVAGRTTIVVSLVGDASTPSSTTSVPVRTVTRTLTVRPGKPLALRLAGRVPSAAALAASGITGDFAALQVQVTTAAAGTQTAMASGIPLLSR